MTTTQEEYKLPNLLKVEDACIQIPLTIEADSISDYERQQREITHVLALLPDEEKAEASLDDGFIQIDTNCMPAIKYANEHYLIDEFATCVTTVANSVLTHHDGEVCCDCIDEFVDEALDKEFKVVTLSGGVFLQFEEGN